MYLVKNNITKEYIVNKSRFIAKIYHIEDIKEIDEILKNVKEEYKDANHYCYAYIIDNKIKCSDDKEPSGTAGLPILNVLKNNDLNNVLCIVIRYFGGIKLGAGGLIRAYTNASVNVIENNITEYIDGYKVRIIFNYEDINQINFILKNYEITYKEYNDKIIYEFLISTIDYNNIKKELPNSSIIKDTKIKGKL